MTTIGIICEYNPFHNGHIYHIKKIKEMYKDSIIILVMSGNFTQRGDISIINKWDKTKIALENNIDLVIELPFVFATQGADVFAKGAIQILNNLKVDKLIFGSECNNISELKELAKIQLQENYNTLVKKYLEKGLNYPTAMSKALKDLGKKELKEPNDILGLCYVKEILKQKSSIEPITIKRTNNYHEKELKQISSATSIREAIKNNKDINNYIPKESIKHINKNGFIDNYFNFLKYKIMTTNNLEIYETVDNINYTIKENIYESNNLEQLINKIKSKRYTYNRIKRMLLHILCDFTKEENKKCENIEYIRILGFNKIGKNYLNKIKKQTNIPIISKFEKNNTMLNIELRSTCIYSLIFENSKEIIESEYKNKPIIK